MPPMRAFALIALSLLASPARAATLRLTYEGSFRGLRILTTQADLTITPSGYLVHATIALAGGATLLVHGHSDVISQGIWQGPAAQPTHLDSESYWNGRPGRLIVDFPAGVPHIRLLQPPDPDKLTALDRAALPGTIDGLGMIAQIIHQLPLTGSCAVHARLFDGHGVTEFDMVATPTPGRCDFTTRKVAGLLASDSPHRVTHGYVLFAAATAGVPSLPARIVVHTGWLGDAILALTAAQPGP